MPARFSRYEISRGIWNKSRQLLVLFLLHHHPSIDVTFQHTGINIEDGCLTLSPPPYPEFHDELHDLPVKSVSLEALVEQKATGKGKRYTGVPVWGTPKRMTSERSKEPVIVTWIVDPTQDDRQEVDGPQISMTEEIFREEADRLGLNCVIIRGAVHETRNIYVNGRTVTVWDASTGRFSKKQKEAESHFTVYMGRSNSELLVQGHIYVVWDPLKFGGLDRMTDPLNQRKHVSVEDGETPVALEYWSLTKDPLPLKSS